MDSAARSTEHTAAVQSVKNTVAKVAAAVRALSGETAAVVFYPAADGASVAEWSAAAEVPAHVHLQPVNCLEEALNYLGSHSRRCTCATRFAASSTSVRAPVHFLRPGRRGP